MFASFDFYSRVFHILVDFTTYDTVHGEAVKNKKKKVQIHIGTGCGKMRNAEYRCGMAIGLELGSAVRVRVMAMAWIRVRFRVVFCRNIAQFLIILHIPHCADAEWVWK